MRSNLSWFDRDHFFVGGPFCYDYSMPALIITLLFLPFVAWADRDIVVEPQKASDVLTLDPSSADLFGKLDGFPHTFEFDVTQALPLKAIVFVHDTEDQKNDASIIVVKKERRGVSEIGRTKAKEASWTASKDAVLVESFRQGGALEASLEPGSYILEVSSPNNDAKYRLAIGNPHRGYFENIKALFQVKRLYDTSYLSAVLSPLLYIPFLGIFVVALALFLWKKKLWLLKK
jgi:hypothetical protein